MNKVFYFIIVWIFMVSFSSAKTIINKHFHQKYDVNEGAALYLKHGDGNVKITAWSNDVVDIDIVYRATFTGMGRLEPQDFEAEFEQRGDRITVTGREPHVFGISSHNVHEYTYTIKAPNYVELNLNGVDGDVSIADWAQNIKAETVDGDIDIDGVTANVVSVSSVDGDVTLENIDADVSVTATDGNITLADLVNSACRCKTVDGDIELDGGSGTFRAESGDGNISVANFQSCLIDANTSDGSIQIDLEKSENLDATLKTVDGDVRVWLAAGTSVELNVKTGDGRIDTDLSPVSNLTTDDNLFRGSIHGGNGILSIRTGDGDVTIVEK